MNVSTTLNRAYLFFLITQWCLYLPKEGFHITFIMQSPKFLMNVSTPLEGGRDALLSWLPFPGW